MPMNGSKSLRRAVSMLGATLLLSGFATGVASADVRYATPKPPTNEDCSQAAPCDLKTAVEGAKNGDEVVIGTGAYTTQTRVKDSASVKLNIHGDFASPRPVIDSSASVALEVDSKDSTVSYLDLRDSAVNGSALSFGGYVGEQILARATGTGASGCEDYGTMLRDSICVATAAGGSGVLADGGTYLFNDTAIGLDSAGVGVRAVTNVGFQADELIARGGQAGADISLEPPSATTYAISNSDYVTLRQLQAGIALDLTNNLTTQPLFANATTAPVGAYPAFDFHQLPGSPTRDDEHVGFSDTTRSTFPAELDVDRQTRVIGATRDIGADEYDPAAPDGPVVVPPPTTTTTPVVPPPVLDRTAPLFSKLAFSPAKFAIKKKGHKAKKGVKYSAKVKYTLSEPAAVVMTFAQKTTGRKVGKSCKKQTTSNKHKKACTLWKTIGSTPRNAAAGASSVTFTGKVGKKTLKIGTYRIQLVATDSSKNRSLIKTLNFKIIVG